MKVVVLLLCASVISAEELVSSNSDDRILREFEESNNQFSSSLYSEVAKSLENNFVVSPFIANLNLFFAQLGSRGQTAREIKRALRLPKDNDITVEELQKLLPKLLRNSDSIDAVNKIYVRHNYPVKASFKDVADDFISGQVENVDFREKIGTAAVINKWAKFKGQNNVRGLIDWEHLNASASLVLVNNLYFTARWSLPFNPVFIHKKKFYKNVEEVVQVQTLHSQNGQKFWYGESFLLDAKILELPFEGDDASLTIILPNQENGLEELEKDIDYALRVKPASNIVVDVEIPRFTIQTHIHLKRLLKNLGVVSAFDSYEADFSGIAGEKGDLVLSDIIQNSDIQLNENGVGAESARPVEPNDVSFVGRPPKFIANHPFIYYVRVRKIIVLVGRVTDPSV